LVFVEELKDLAHLGMVGLSMLEVKVTNTTEETSEMETKMIKPTSMTKTDMEVLKDHGLEMAMAMVMITTATGMGRIMGETLEMVMDTTTMATMEMMAITMMAMDPFYLHPLFCLHFPSFQFSPHPQFMEETTKQDGIMAMAAMTEATIKEVKT
jgi:hypothetical protein